MSKRKITDGPVISKTKLELGCADGSVGRCLSCQHENMSSIPQNPHHKSQGGVVGLGDGSVDENICSVLGGESDSPAPMRKAR